MDFQRFSKRAVLLSVLAMFAASFNIYAAARAEQDESKQIAVFIPGVMSGSPIYEMLAQGVQKAAAEKTDVQVRIIEAGFNQAEWESKLNSLAASGNFDLIVSSNPSLPALAASVSRNFPAQKFLLLDGELEGNPSIYTMRYNQREQAYMAGHIAALVSQAGMGTGRDPLKIGLIAGQEYPAMNTIILPGYLEGARAVDPAFQTDFRVVGNWFDAAKAAELASGMIRDGVSVILCITGGANQGVVQAASESGIKVVWFDINGYDVMPGTVIGSSILRQDKAAYEQTRRYLEGRLPFGSAELVGVADSYVDFIEDDVLYIQHVPEEVRRLQAALTAQLRSGSMQLPDKK